MKIMSVIRNRLFIFIVVVTFIIAVHTSRPSRRSLQNLAQLAFAHGVRVQAEGSCKTPHPQIVYVPINDPAKVYLPRGTILHRCSDQTGCCPDATESCQPLRKEEVTLHFITYTLSAHPHSSSTSSSSVHHRGHVRRSKRQGFEKLSFTNHTQCGCRPIAEANAASDELEANLTDNDSDGDLNEV